MPEPLWVVGQVLGGDPSGRIAWRKLGIFLDRADAAAWARVCGANLLVDVAPGGVALPPFGELAAGQVTMREEV